MRARRLWWSALPALVFCVTMRPGLAQGPKNNPEEETALQKRAEAFVAAFQRGDAQALADFQASWKLATTSESTPRPHHRVEQRLVIEGLLQEGNGAGPEGLLTHALLRVGTNEDDGNVQAVGPQALLQL